MPDRPKALALARRLVSAGMAHPLPPAGGGGAGGGQAMAGVSVVIPVRDDPAGLGRTLARLGPVGEVVVVDDGSSPAQARLTAEVVAATAKLGRAGLEPAGPQSAGSAMRLLTSPTNEGPAAARNRGWRASSGQTVAFVDAGCQPEPGWLERLAAHLGDPSVGAVAPRITSLLGAGPGGGWSEPIAAYEASRSPLDLGPDPGLVSRRGRIAYVPGATLVVRRSALLAAGGFDETLRVGEDVDLVWRLSLAGWPVRYQPEARVGHPPRPTLAAWGAQRLAYGRSGPALARRHGRAVSPVRMSAAGAAFWAAALATCGLVGPGRGGRRLGGRGQAGRGLAGRGLASVVAAGAVTAGAVMDTALLARRLGRLQHPWWQAIRLTTGYHLVTGAQLARAASRDWWPAAVTAALVSRSARRTLLASAVTAPTLGWLRTRPDLGLASWIGLWVLDDLAYGTGQWLGCWAERSPGALLAELTSSGPRLRRPVANSSARPVIPSFW